MATVTTEDIKKIATGFLLNAPPGEFHEIVTDVRALLNNDNLLNEIAEDACREYNTEQMLVVDVGDHKAIVTKFASKGADEFWDPQTNKVFKYNHLTNEVGDVRDISPDELDSESEPFRAALEAKVIEYTKNHYDRGTGAVFSAKGGPITICISSSVLNSSNFYNGRWRSVWNVKIAGGKATLSGSVKVQVHYFEDGNVQLHTNFVRSKDGIAASSPAALADAVIKTIADNESDYQSQLEASYEKMNNTTFKALRRGLPIFGTKIKWEKITQYSIGGDLNNKNVK